MDSEKISKVALVAAGLAILGGLAWLAYMLYVADGTVYAPGYNEQRFTHVKAGMTNVQVRQMLGKPFNIYTIGTNRVWEYTNWDPDRGDRYRIREVRFDSRGKVVRTISRSCRHEC